MNYTILRSPTVLSDKILPIVKEWQERLLESVYAVVFMDAMYYAHKAYHTGTTERFESRRKKNVIAGIV